MPFDKVAQMMEELLAVQTHEETVRRLTEQAGSWMEAAETMADCEPKEEQPLQRCAFSTDGAMISLVHKQWVETRTVAIGEPEEKRGADGEVEIHVGKLSYFSRLADASAFANLAEVEMRRRKVREAKEVCAVVDGAEWCQTFTDRHRPDAVRVLDFPHAAEHLTQLLEVLENAKMHFPPRMLERCLHILKHRNPHLLLRMADRMESHLAEQKGVHEHLDYLRKRETLMQYREFRNSGWPIGSGMVESANKNLVEARLKGAGMHWERNNVNPMLALRSAVYNDRWREMWQKAIVQQRKLQAKHRSTRSQQQAQALLTVGNASPQQASPLETEPPAVPLGSAAAQPASTRGERASARTENFPQASGTGNSETCFCGAPLVQSQDRQSRRYCSSRCRGRAYRMRQAHSRSLSASLAPPSGATQSRSTCSSAHHDGVSAQMKGEPLAVQKERREVCPCGTPLVLLGGHRIREYCSDRCRQRAHRQRQKKTS
jgi:hypothetical protein